MIPTADIGEIPSSTLWYQTWEGRAFGIAKLSKPYAFKAVSMKDRFNWIDC